MKKMNVLLAAFTLAIVAVTPMTSSAADISPTTESTNTMTLSKTYASHYTLHIPDKTPTLTDESVNVDFGVTGYLEFDKKLTVTVTSENDWELKDKDHLDNESGVSYKMKVGERYITTEENDVMSITAANNNNKIETELTFCEFGNAAYAGTYGDTLTFEVSSETIPKGELTTEAATTTTEATTPEAVTTETTTAAEN